MSQKETQLQQKLVTLRTRLLLMCASTQIALEDACTALLERDEGKAHAVIEGDDAIDTLENEIDDKALSLLAREQPVAGDLRMVVSALRMVIDLERIADEAVNIAERAILMQGMPQYPHMLEIQRFMTLARNTFADAVLAFRDGDMEKVADVRLSEDNSSDLEMKIIQSLLNGNKEQPQTGENSYFVLEPWNAMHIILISRSINRIVRRSANIAEHAWFAHQGTSLKHKPSV